MNRIFTSFAMEDLNLKVLFTGQAKKDGMPYEFFDMSVKEPWSSSWKTNCRSRIKGCDGVIVLVTKNLKKADGALWEIQCATEEKIPVLGVYMADSSILDVPDCLMRYKLVTWTWLNIANFVNNL